MHTVKVVGYQPYHLKESPQHWDVIKQQVSDANLNYVRRFSPNLREDKILARTVESPLDLERMNPYNWHGNCHGDAQNAAQSGAMRPVGRSTACRFPACTGLARPRTRVARSSERREERRGDGHAQGFRD